MKFADLSTERVTEILYRNYTEMRSPFLVKVPEIQNEPSQENHNFDFKVKKNAGVWCALACSAGRETCTGNTPWSLSSTWNSPAALSPSPASSSRKGTTRADSLGETGQEGCEREEEEEVMAGMWRKCSRTWTPTCRCGVADGEGGQRGVQAVDGVVEVLGEEDMALHRLAGQMVQLLPPRGKKKSFKKRLHCKTEKKSLVSLLHTWGSGGPRRTGPRPSLWAEQPPAPRCPETSHLIRGWRSGPQRRSCDRLGNLSWARTSEPGLSGCCLPWEFTVWKSVTLTEQLEDMFCATETGRVDSLPRVTAKVNHESILFGFPDRTCTLNCLSVGCVSSPQGSRNPFKVCHVFFLFFFKKT